MLRSRQEKISILVGNGGITLMTQLLIYRVLIDKLNVSPLYKNAKTGNMTFNRIIPGLNVVVPWPKQKADEETKGDTKETKDDTTKAQQPKPEPTKTPDHLVHKITFNNPTLAYPPLPAGIELELHNRYSKFKRRKFAMVKEQVEEWQRRYIPGVAQAESIAKENEKKEQNIYTAEQLRIRAANKLVKKARRTHLKRKTLTDEDIILLATYMENHFEAKLAEVETQQKMGAPLTPLEQRMSVEERLEDRKKRIELEKEERKKRKEAALAHRAKMLLPPENKGRYKKHVITESVRPKLRFKKKKKKRGPKLVFKTNTAAKRTE